MFITKAMQALSLEASTIHMQLLNRDPNKCFLLENNDTFYGMFIPDWCKRKYDPFIISEAWEGTNFDWTAPPPLDSSQSIYPNSSHSMHHSMYATGLPTGLRTGVRTSLPTNRCDPDDDYKPPSERM
eukprot:Platyproteum_vivax@DN4375_c0_g1_i1.p1